MPSLLYYDKSGNVKAAGAEVLTEGTTEAALTEGWTMVEWLVVNHVEAFMELILVHEIKVEASPPPEASSLLY